VSGRGSIVTGGGGGIGLAVARVLGGRGPVGVVDISADAVQAAVRTLEAENITVHGVVADVSDEADLVAALGSIAPPIEPRVLVTAAGDVDYADPLELDAARFTRMLAMHVVGTFIAARTLHPYLRRGDGRMVAIGSLAAHQGSPLHVHYAAAKAGIEGLVRSLAASWSADGIRCNVVVPGTIRTPMFDRVPDEVRAAYMAAPGGVGEPADIAAAVAHLADPAAGRFVNGTTLHVDGGARLAVRPSDKR
jgi:NAD(P)-dependent dehydrogenase (short-subunit alcohol dehydrogenase family)